MAIEFKLAPLFGNGAVLCRRKEVRVWGTAADGQTVTGRVMTADGLILSEGICTARDGRFLLHLPPMEQATSCTLTVTCGAETCTSTDISIGEVYLASGQSNMELELQNADEGQDLIAAHDDPLVHYFNVPKRASGMTTRLQPKPLPAGSVSAPAMRGICPPWRTSSPANSRGRLTALSALLTATGAVHP